MKKQLFLMSALALTTLATAASCGKKGNQPYTPGTQLKVGLICVENRNSTYDANFITAFETAIKWAKEKGYVSSHEIRTDVNDKTRDAYNAAEDLVNSGYNIVFSNSFGHDLYMHEAANEFKNVQFSSATGVEARTAGLSNFHNAFASIYEGRYLAGLAAGYNYIEKHPSATGTVKIGYVGAYPYAEVKSGFTAWYLGVKKALETKNLDVTMDVKYTNEWYDPTGEYNAANALITSGCEIISQHADSMGAPNACVADGRKVPNVSYNVDTTDGGKKTEFIGSYVAHSRIDWTSYYEQFIESVFKGEKLEGETEQNWTGTLKSGSVVYNVDYDNMVTDSDHKTAIENASKDLQSGTLHVFDTNKFTVSKSKNKDAQIELTGDTEGEKGTLVSYKADTTGDYQPDQELVKDGHIEESVYRSAPSFDLIIDGITELAK